MKSLVHVLVIFLLVFEPTEAFVGKLLGFAARKALKHVDPVIAARKVVEHVGPAIAGTAIGAKVVDIANNILRNDDDDDVMIFYHYTNYIGYEAIRQKEEFNPGTSFTTEQLSSQETLNALFLGNPKYKDKGEYYFKLLVRQPKSVMELWPNIRNEWRNRQRLLCKKGDKYCTIVAHGRNPF